MLFTKIEELIEHVRIPRSIKIDQIKAAILVAENSHIKPAITSEMYAEIEAAYQESVKNTSATALTADQKALWNKIAFPLAQLTVFEAINTMNLGFSDSGFVRNETENQKSAYEYQVNRFEEQCKLNGFRGLDWLIDYLEENKETFTTYRDSAERAERLKLFISSVSMFDEHVKLGSSWIFQQLQPQIKRAEQGKIKSIIGATLFDTIKSELASESLSTDNQNLLESYIRPSIAHLAFADGLIELKMRVSDKGITIYNTDEGVRQRKPASDSQVNDLERHHRALAERYLDELSDKIKTDADPEASTKPEFITSSTQKSSAFL